MWQKVEKFKGAEYFRKALYLPIPIFKKKNYLFVVSKIYREYVQLIDHTSQR